MEISDYFWLAVKNYFATFPWGAQKKIAKELNIQRSYLNEFVNKKKPLSEKLRVRFAEYIGFNYEELIALGRKLSNQSPEILKEQEKILAKGFDPKLVKAIREKHFVNSKKIAQWLNISLTEFEFKERGLIPFTFSELSILFDKIGKRGLELDYKKEEIAANRVDLIKQQIAELSDEEKEELKKGM